MRGSLLTFVVLSALPAQAQFANRSLGVSATASTTISNSQLYGLTLEGSHYIENGFDVYLRVPLVVASTQLGADTVSGKGWVLGTGTNLGVRYLLSEQQVRPYLGVHLSALVLITKPEIQYFFGPGATAGLDWFFADAFSIGARTSYDLFIDLNKPLRHHFSGGVVLATGF